MTGFTDIFGGNNISPAALSFLDYTLAANTQFYWPLEASSTGPYVASKIQVTASSASLAMTLPNATLVTPGQDTLIINIGANSFDVKSYDGTVIGTVAAGESWFFYLTDNADADGSWSSTQQGAGSSSATAGSLAGLGLVAASSLLNTALTTSTKNANYTLVANDRASNVVNTGGTITFSITAAATLGSTWFCNVRNDGSGTLTIDPDGAELIDGLATKSLAIGESCTITCDASQFRTIGYGRSVTSTVTALNVAGGGGAGTQTLTSTEVAAQVQDFTGTLTGNRNYEYGTTAGYWYVSNSMTLAGFTATWRVNGADTGVTSANLAAGARNILVSNGTNMFLALSTATGTVTSVATGTGLTGGPITTTGTVALANTAVTPGTYEVASITVDAQGRLTAASEPFASSDVVRLTPAQSLVGAKRGTVSSVVYAASVALDLSTSNNYEVGALTGNIILANPTNIVAGQSGVVTLTQDGTGSRLASFGAYWKFASGTAPSLSTTAGAVDVLVYYVNSATFITANLIKGVA